MRLVLVILLLSLPLLEQNAGAQETRAPAAPLPNVVLIFAQQPRNERPIDGRDIRPLISAEPGAASPHQALFFYWGHELQAVRSGKWKLHLPHNYPRPAPPGSDGQPGPTKVMNIELSLYDLEQDPGETKNLAAAHPDIVARLEALAESCRDDLGDAATKRRGKNVREPGKANTPGPSTVHAAATRPS